MQGMTSTAPGPLETLERVFGYDSFRGDQAAIIDRSWPAATRSC